MDVMRQSACLVVNPVGVNKFAVLFNCMPVGHGSDSRPNIKLFGWFGLDTCLFLGPSGSTLWFFFCFSVPVVLLTPQESPGVSMRYNCRVLILASLQSFH